MALLSAAGVAAGWVSAVLEDVSAVGAAVGVAVVVSAVGVAVGVAVVVSVTGTAVPLRDPEKRVERAAVATLRIRRKLVDRMRVRRNLVNCQGRVPDISADRLRCKGSRELTLPPDVAVLLTTRSALLLCAVKLWKP